LHGSGAEVQSQRCQVLDELEKALEKARLLDSGLVVSAQCARKIIKALQWTLETIFLQHLDQVALMISLCALKQMMGLWHPGLPCKCE
jgi:hypothetical protein